MNRRFIFLVSFTIAGMILNTCSRFDDLILFSGSNPARVTDVDTSDLYTDLRNVSGLEWSIFKLPAEGVPLDCFYIKSEQTETDTGVRNIVLFFSGNDMSFWNNYGDWDCLRALGADFMTIDWRGYGRSLGEFTVTEESCYHDAEQAISYLTDSLDYSVNDICLTGFSMGSGVATEMAKRHDTRCLILFAPFVSMDAAASGITGGYNIPSNWLLDSEFNTIDKINAINQPVYFLAGKEDMLFPPEDNAVVLYNKAKNPKHLMLMDGMNHPGLIAKSCRLWQDTLAAFIADCR